VQEQLVGQHPLRPHPGEPVPRGGAAGVLTGSGPAAGAAAWVVRQPADTRDAGISTSRCDRPAPERGPGLSGGRTRYSQATPFLLRSSAPR
jgi:hypothetical protein